MSFYVFLSGLGAGAGLMAVIIFATDAWYAHRHPITRARA